MEEGDDEDNDGGHIVANFCCSLIFLNVDV